MRDPERPEQIAERIVNDAWIFYDERSELDRRKLREAIVAAIHAERARTAEAVSVIEAIIYASDGCQGHRHCTHSMNGWQRARKLLMKRDAASEDRSHAK